MTHSATTATMPSTSTDERATDDNRVGTAYNLLVQWDEIRRLAQARGMYTPAMDAFMNEVSRLVAGSPEPAATFDEVLNVISRERTKSTAQPCHVYPGLCVVEDGESGDAVDEHGHHYDHAGHSYTVPSSKCPNDPEIWAEFVHVSAGTPHIAFMGETLTPDQTREKATQIRKLADEMDALADQVETAVAATQGKAAA